MQLTPEILARVKAQWLPADADTHGFDDAGITAAWTGGIARTVRKYWFKRVSDTAGYLDLNDASGNLPITQIYRQAREMLDYWDNFLKLYGNVDPDLVGGSTRIGKIKNRYPHPKYVNALIVGGQYEPYQSSD